jgi:hypothetical protein
MTGTPLSDEEIERIQELHEQGRTRNEIARELGRSPGTITNHCNRLGLSFDRTQVIAMNRARRADAETRRRELTENLLDDAERIRQRMWNRFTQVQYVGRDGVRREDELEEPPPHEQLAYARTMNVLLTQHAKLAAMDDDGGLTGALEGLKSLGSALVSLAGGGDDDVEHEDG